MWHKCYKKYGFHELKSEFCYSFEETKCQNCWFRWTETVYPPKIEWNCVIKQQSKFTVDAEVNMAA